MQYKLGDTGPFHLTKEEREKLIHDCELDEMQTKKITRAQLIDNIKTHTHLSNIRGTLADI